MKDPDDTIVLQSQEAVVTGGNQLLLFNFSRQTIAVKCTGNPYHDTLKQCWFIVWPSVCNAGPTSNQHCFYASCLQTRDVNPMLG